MLSADPPTTYRWRSAEMKGTKKRGPGPSHVLLTPDHAGNVIGIDPHKRTLTATVADARGGILAAAHFRVSGEGHRELEAWARQFGQIARWALRARRAGVGTQPCSWSAAATTYVTSARTARRALIAPVSAASPTRSTVSESPARRWRTRCCPRRSSARALTAAPTTSDSCWRCGTTGVGRSCRSSAPPRRGRAVAL
jgi:hypothetical protein